MSQRGKRPNRTDDGTVPTKRRKCRPTAEEEEAAAMAAVAQAAWQPRPLNDLKISSIYNRSATEAPAELFRKDLISAMKLPDSEPLAADEYWVINDQWKQEWERGVQVPVNPDSLPEPSVTVTQCANITKPSNEFKLPKTKYIRITKDEQFVAEEHMLSTTPAKAEAACSYDLDDCDSAWLQLLNGERAQAGLGPVSEDQLERVLEQLELHCWDRIQTIMKNEEGLGIEYDENVICDVCRSPDSEEGNEMVFCDSCNICVHQACYGITSIPAGQWLCCTCALGQRPDCVLCPNKGGAMKCTRSGQKWAHVSCALWIPEVSIGCVERMEPITKISSIPQSRWALICVLCRERVGACIQCSVKTCKTAYHVTCAFKHGLEMRAIIEDENADDGVKLRSYCQKHSKKEKSVCSGSEDDDSKRKKRKDMTSEEKNQARAARLQEIEAEFDKHVSVKDILQPEVDADGLQYIYNYWKLKRRAGHNKPLLPPKSEDVDMLSHKQEQADLEKMKMFVQLRQDLERVRNLCYMVSRREKLSRMFFKMREQTFHKQVAVLSASGNMNASTVAAVVEANHGPSIYDRLYSHSKAEDHTTDFETVLARIAGLKSPPNESGDEKKLDLNGIVKERKSLSNPYKRLYFNGSSKRRSGSLYGSSLSSSASEHETKPEVHHSPENEKVSPSSARKKANRLRKTGEGGKAVQRRRNRLSSVASHTKSESSSEEDIKPGKKDWSQWPRNRTLQQMEQELTDKNVSGTDSDELMPIKFSKPTETQKLSAIYSDSDSSDVSAKNEDKANVTSDFHQNKLRTKAAMKEFNMLSKPATGASPKSTNSASVKKKPDEDAVVVKKEVQSPSKQNKKKKDYVPTELIVPQRQAAKKASENLKITTSRSKESTNANAEPEQKTPVQAMEDKPEKGDKAGKPSKPKPKVSKEIGKESKEPKEKDTSKKETRTEVKCTDVFDIDKEFEKEDVQEIFAYVPQRQAAKKAAEHIKSGLGKPVAADAVELDGAKVTKQKEPEKEPVAKARAKEPEVVRPNNNNNNNKKDLPEHDKPSKISSSKRKSSTNSTCSSSSSSSSTSSTSSSSDSEEEGSVTAHPLSSKSSFSSTSSAEPKKNSSKDWPFLDKAAKSAVPASSSSDSSDTLPAPKKSPITTTPATGRGPARGSRPTAPSKKKHEDTTEAPPASDKLSQNKKVRKVTDKRPKTGDRRESSAAEPAAPKREEPPRASSSAGGGGSSSGKQPRPPGRPRIKKSSHSGDRLGDADVRARDLPDGERVGGGVERRKPLSSNEPLPVATSPADKDAAKCENRSRKPDEVGRDGDPAREPEPTAKAVSKESLKSRQLSSPLRKADKKLDKSPDKMSSPVQLANLEREIMERKAGRDLNSRRHSSKGSTLDKLFEKRDKKLDKQTSNASPVKENREPPAQPSVDASNARNVFKHRTKDEDDPVGKLNTMESEGPQERRKRASSPRYKKPEPLPDFRNKNLDSKTHESKTTSKHEVLADKHTKSKEEKAMVVEICEENVSMHKSNSDTTLQNDMESDKKSDKVTASGPPAYINRSIFSPQPSVKDSACSEIFDFDNDMLNVDESANDDGFSIPRDSEEMMRASLSFTFNNEFLFKEDSKEDSARETLNLVEKLRMKLSKKSTTSGTTDGSEDAISTKEEPENKPDKLPSEPDDNVDPVQPVEKTESLPTEMEVQQMADDRVLVSYVESEHNSTYHYSSCEAEVMQQHLEMNVKILVPMSSEHHLVHGGMESARADERWPTTVDGFPLDIQAHADKLYPDVAVHLQQAAATFLPPSQELQQQQQQQQQQQLTAQQVAAQQAAQHAVQQAAHEQQLASLGEELQLQQHQHQQQHNKDPSTFMEPTSMDCLASPSPYADMHQQAKWADSEVLPTRRSSSSSAASTASSGSQRGVADVADLSELSKRDDLLLANHTALAASASMLPDLAFGMLAQPFPPSSLADTLSYHPYSEASQFVTGPVSLFPAPGPPPPVAPPGVVGAAQLPFASPGAAMFPPSYGAPFPAPPIPAMPTLGPAPGPPQPCTAAFTSSSHNMALTAAMMSLPPPPPQLQLQPQPELHASASHEQHDEDVAPQQPEQQPVPQPPVPATQTFQVEDVPPASPPAVPPAPTVNHASPVSAKSVPAAGKKSPSKPTRTSARVTSQQQQQQLLQQGKSPSKSPGKSPRQQLLPDAGRTGPGRPGRADGTRRAPAGSRGGARSGYGQARGRGRGRGRARTNHLSHIDMDPFGANTIHKLVGTVYDLDFDDDIHDEMENLRAMRERRRSTDVHERKAETGNCYVSRDSPQSPKLTSPVQMHGGKLTRVADLRELRPPTPVDEQLGVSTERTTGTCMGTAAVDDGPRAFPDIGQPVLPGPVDMRTYNTAFASMTSSCADAKQMLGVFASGTADQQLPDIDEDFEKALHASLTSNKPRADPTPTVPAADECSDPRTAATDTTVAPAADVSHAVDIKVSLSDSRNQLKVKIKGPFLDAKYSASTVAPLPLAAPSDPLMEGAAAIAAATSVNSCAMMATAGAGGAGGGGSSSGTSNLRRMRKKELLRQYWTQDMNMDEAAAGGVAGAAIAPAAAPQVSRTIVTIPKAVESMTSIPTREDYKAVVDANMEKKRRKAGAADLRHLDAALMDEDEMPAERRRSVGSTGSNASVGADPLAPATTYRRKGRPPRPSHHHHHPTQPQLTQPTTPKLKIKFGGLGVGDSTCTVDDKRNKGRPPKKRLSHGLPMPSVEDLRRESMKYRKMVMADFDEEKKRSRSERSGRKKRRKVKPELQIISNECATPTKLIIRFGKRRDDAMDGQCAGADPGPRTEQATDGRTAAPPSPPDPPPDKPATHDSHSGTAALRKVRSAKMTPIRLKISRCQQGSGYVMKSNTEPTAAGAGAGVGASAGADTAPTVAGVVSAPVGASASAGAGATTADDAPSDVATGAAVVTVPADANDTAPGCVPLPLNKDCEVR